jgi:WD40 repeat protein
MTGRIGGGVSVFDLTTTQVVGRFKLPGTVHALAWSPDGERMAASYKLGTNWVVGIHNFATLERLVTVECPETIEFIAWHPGSQWISVTGAGDSEWHRQVRLIDVSSGRLAVLGRHKLKVARLVFTGDGRHLISCGWDRDLICWDLRTMQRSFTFPAIGYHQGWNREGTRCAALSRDDTIQLYEFQSPLSRELLTGLADGFVTGEYSPNGRWLAVSGVRLVSVWDLQNDGPPAAFPKPNAHRIVFTPDSKDLIVSGDDALSRWRLVPATQAGAAPELVARPMPAAKNPRRVNVSRDELVLTAADGVRFAALTNLDAGIWDRFVPARDGWGQTSPDGQRLAFRYHYSKSVRVYQLPEVKALKQVTASNYVFSATFSPDGREMIVLHRDGADWWDTATWERKRYYTDAPVPGSFVFYTPDGSGLWTAIHFRSMGLHDQRTLEPLLLLPAETTPVAVSPDNQFLVVSIDRRRVQIWYLPELRQEFQRLGIDWVR